MSDWHTCHFCGENVKDGLDPEGKRHWLSDCRPDLVEHEIGETCTWHGLNSEGADCYAYQNRDRKWTSEHKYFYEDGPM